MLGETCSGRLSRSLFEYETTLSIDEATQNGDFNMDVFPASTRIDYDLKAVAEFMKSRHLRKVDRVVYEVNQRGFDMHSTHLDFDLKFNEANSALTNFINELKSQGTWDNKVILMGSDFGRSVAPNSNGGSNHGWGSHYFTLGGSLKGSKIRGKYCSKMFTAYDLFEGEARKPCIDDLDGDGVADAQDACEDTMYWMNVPLNLSGYTGPVATWPTPKQPDSPSSPPLPRPSLLEMEEHKDGNSK